MDEKSQQEILNALERFQANQPYIQPERESSVDIRVTPPKIVAWVMKISGKEQKQSEYIIFGIVILSLCISLFFLFKILSPSRPDVIPRFVEDIDPDVRVKLPPDVLRLTIPSKHEAQR